MQTSESNRETGGRAASAAVGNSGSRVSPAKISAADGDYGQASRLSQKYPASVRVRVGPGGLGSGSNRRHRQKKTKLSTAAAPSMFRNPICKARPPGIGIRSELRIALARVDLCALAPPLCPRWRLGGRGGAPATRRSDARARTRILRAYPTQQAPTPSPPARIGAVCALIGY